MSSVGIIGGADGPTKVFVSGTKVFASGTVWPWALFAAALLALVLFLILRKK